MTTQQTVGDIAAEAPAAVTIFEKYAIDYCCGGKRPLEDACRERGLSAEAVLAEVRAWATQAGASRDWTSASLADLIEHIVSTHHEFLKRELPALQRRLAKVVEVHGEKQPALQSLSNVYQGLQDELEGHLRKEEFILFPFIVELEAARRQGKRGTNPPFGTVRNPIRMMMHEHDSAGTALARMRDLTHNYTLPADACTTYRALYEGLQQLEADLHRHIHLENNILFPRAAKLEGE